MFRRSSSETDTTGGVATTRHGTDTPAKVGGKGRPTPTRKEAEAAYRARNRPVRTRKEQRRRQREAQSEQSRKMREAMKTGDEKHMLARDKGPVRRYIRDFVDSRFGFAEVTIPVLLVSLFVPQVVVPIFVVLIIDLLVLRYRVRKRVTERFPDASLKGTTYYAITRAMQLRFMRLPKTQVRIGQDLSERSYR